MKKTLAIVISFTLLITTFMMPIDVQATDVGKVTSISITGKTHNSASLKRKRVKGATGYQVYYSTSKTKNYKKAKTIKKGSIVKTKVTSLKSNKRYYFKVRAVMNKKTGKFSKTISTKTKLSPKAALNKKLLSSRWKESHNNNFFKGSLTFTFLKSGRINIHPSGDYVNEYHSAADYSGWTYKYLKGENAYMIIASDGTAYGIIYNTKNANTLKLSIVNGGHSTLHKVK